MKKSLRATLAASAIVLSFGLATAQAQVADEALEAESLGNLWFVELSGNPTADGNSLKNVQSEKAAFKAAVRAAGVKFKEVRSFDTLFNGYSVEIDASNRNKLAQVNGVKALWPVEVINAPEVIPGGGAPDLSRALGLTGADIAQNSLGYTGAGVKVAVMDTGIDYDHVAFGGDGVNRENSPFFPNSRVIAGYDFVGDAFTAGLTPVPDDYPDDCGSAGHGTHVAGIVGAQGPITGVAPNVKFGAYRVFGCSGSTTADIMIAAMERALADGMHVLNMSIGSRAQWPQYPTGAAGTRLVNKGVVVVASIGNNGPGGSQPDGVYAAGAPGVGSKVIGTASYDNGQLSFNVDGTPYGYNQASGSPTAPTSGSLPMAKTGTPTSTNDGCNAVAPAPGSLTGKAVLIRRGTCGFNEKANNAQLAGAAAVVLYNNAAGALNPSVATGPVINIPVVAVTAAQGATLDGLIAGGPTTLVWTGNVVGFPFGTGGLISGFSSFGMAADLSLKPDIGAPGGGIVSTLPLAQGGSGPNSGTSMSSPHVAGAVALLLEAKPKTSAQSVRSRLQNSADPTLWSGNPVLGFLEQAHRQGAGMLDIDDTILATTHVEPGKLSLGESSVGPSVQTLTIKNDGGSPVTYDLSHAPALATGPAPIAPATFQSVGSFANFASASFSAASVVVPAGGSASVDVTITAPAGPALGQYSGYVVLTEQGSGKVFRVPYAGFIGDYQDTVVLKPTLSGFPWLAKTTNGTSFSNRNDTTAFPSVVYTMVGFDIPSFAIHLDHQSRRVRLEAFDANTGTSWHRISDDQYVGRNTSSTGFFAFTWDGTTFTGKGKNANQHYTAPNGDYVVKVSVLKALGDENNPAHWETWTSRPFTIARP